MSQITRNAPPPPSQQQPPSEVTTKKKFGKNLNKLTRPPSPPAASAAKVNTASKNGLLLLSTKRSAGGGNVPASSGGILSNKSTYTASKPLPSLGLQCQSNTSTHDALLGAVVGASRAEAQHQPDAWGVADKKEKSESSTAASGDKKQPSNQTQQHISHYGKQGPDAGTNQGINNMSADPEASWDEYGGRNRDTNGRLAKGGMLWGEENSKHVQTAAQRNKEGTNSRTPKNRDEVVSKPGNGTITPQRPKLLLAKLNRSQGVTDDNRQGNPAEKSTEKETPRTLYDPNGVKSYSSLVGGVKSNDDRDAGVPSLEQGGNGGTVHLDFSSPDASSMNDSRDPSYGRKQVIQLSSYETRDRGERNVNSGPRMLFDPKSGSMVAVPSRDDAVSSAKGRKERGKKGRKEKDAKTEKSDSRDNGRPSRKGKQKRDDAKTTSPSKAEAKKGRATNNRKFPRTRGVLYARDNKGSLHSVDGCDGDLGYGAHCVPGGRTKNADAYAKYVEYQKQLPEDDVDYYHGHSLEMSYEKDTTDHGHGQFVALQTGFSVQEPAKLDWVKPNEKISLVTGVDDSPTLQATAREWAPSGAALAAAAAAFEQEKESMPSPVHGNDDDEEEGDDAPVSISNTMNSFQLHLFWFISNQCFAVGTRIRSNTDGFRHPVAVVRACV